MISEILPLTKRKLKILLALYLYGPLHISEIARKTNLEKQNVSLQAKKFIEKGMVRIHKKIGRSLEISLSETLVDNFKWILEEFRKEQLFDKNSKLEGILRYLTKNIKDIKKIYLIGSYLKDGKKNDLDLVIVGNNFDEKLIENQIKLLYNIDLDIIPFTGKNFEKELKSESKFYQTTFRNKADNLLLLEN